VEYLFPHNVTVIYKYCNTEQSMRAKIATATVAHPHGRQRLQACLPRFSGLSEHPAGVHAISIATPEQ
jgi:hypothetical protein